MSIKSSDLVNNAIEECPILDIGELKKAGLFAAPYACEWHTEGVHRWVFFDDKEGTIKLRPPEDEDGEEQIIKTTTRQITFGMRRYFLDYDGRLAIRYYYLNGIFSSRHSHGLGYLAQKQGRRTYNQRYRLQKIENRVLGKDGRAPPTGRQRKILLGKLLLAGLDAPRGGDYALVALNEIEKGEQRRRRRPSKQPLRWASTSMAIKLAVFSPASAIDIEIELLTDRTRWRQTGVYSRPTSPWGFDPIPLTAVPELDLRALTRAGLFEPRSRNAINLVWSDPKFGHWRAFVLSDLTQPTRPLLMVRTWHEKSPAVTQYIEIAPLRRKGAMRWRAHCPTSSQFHDVLYFRSGWFASEAALNLKRRSKRR